MGKLDIVRDALNELTGTGKAFTKLRKNIKKEGDAHHVAVMSATKQHPETEPIPGAMKLPNGATQVRYTHPDVKAAQKGMHDWAKKSVRADRLASAISAKKRAKAAFSDAVKYGNPRFQKEELELLPEGYDEGPDFELNEDNSVDQLQQKRAYHDVQSQTNNFAAKLHMDKSLSSMDDHPEMSDWHSQQADKHYARANRHDQAWEKAHSLIAKASGYDQETPDPAHLAKEEVELEEGRGRPRKDGTSKSEEDAGDQNIVSQLRKTVAVRGHSVRFDNGETHHIPYETASHALAKHMSTHPLQRGSIQKALSHSKASFDRVVRS